MDVRILHAINFGDLEESVYFSSNFDIICWHMIYDGAQIVPIVHHFICK